MMLKYVTIINDKVDRKMDGNLIDIVADSIIEYNTDTAIDLLDVGICDILEETALKEIPVVKTVTNIAKTGIAIRERFLLKKTLNFIKKLKNNLLSDDEYNKYVERIKLKDKNLYSELERVLIIIDRMLDARKSDILANLYYSFICKKITWDEFEELSIITDNLFVNDIHDLEIIYNKKQIKSNEIINHTIINRLTTLNLLQKIESIMREDNGSLSFGFEEYDYSITDLGLKLIEFGVKNGLS